MDANEQRNLHPPGRWWARMLPTIGWAVWGLTVAAGTPRPPAFPALDLGSEHLDPGELLLGELNCLACHAAEPAVSSRLQPHPAPSLGRVAGRLKPAYLRTWLLDPLAAKPGTTMPDALHRLPATERGAAASELTHFLASLPDVAVPPPAPRAGSLPLQQGRVLYHQVGCVACHAPFEAAAAVFRGTSGAPTDDDALRYTLARLQETSQPLPELAAKYHSGALPALLADPLVARPGGRMPSLKLTEAESRAIAAYLLEVTAGTNQTETAVEPGFVSDAALARRGRERFAELGCAACHSLSVGGVSVVSRLAARPLAALDPAAPGGCLAPEPPVGVPRFVLSPAQREGLRSAITNLARGGGGGSPARRVTLTLAAFNCTACHSRDGLGGPGPSRWDYFTTLSDADLGDEGRIPPHLGAVGNKLRREWLGQVLTNRGVVRPYLAVRMPQYGATNVARLVTDFHAADATPELRAPAPAGEADAGRALVGVGGYSCVTCHRFGPHPSLGISVMDLTQMAKRIEWDWFRRYLLDPASLRPGTRMPSFWPEGKATVPALLDGDTERQVAAIWAYLQLGAEAAPPPGLLENAPRTEAGPRADYE